MRIERLEMLACGPFQGQGWDLPTHARDFYVVFGPNEAGKSSLLRGITALLFGFEERAPEAFRIPYTELRVGGTIARPGERLSFRRRKGRRNSLLDVHDAPLPDDALAPFLAGIDRAQFSQLYGLDAEQLRTGGDSILNAGGDAGGILFEAGGLAGIRKLLNELEARAAELFAPSGRKPMINAAIDQYKDARRTAKQSGVRADEVEQMYVRVAEAENASRSAKAASAENRERISRLERIASNKADLIRLQELDADLAELTDVPILDRTARERRLAAERTIRAAAEELQRLDQSAEGRRAKLAALPVAPRVLEHAARISGLHKEIGAYLQNRTDLPKRQSEADEKERAAREAWTRAWPDRELLEAAWRGREPSGPPLPAIEARPQASVCSQGEQRGSDPAKSGEPPDHETVLALLKDRESIEKLKANDGTLAGREQEVATALARAEDKLAAAQGALVHPASPSGAALQAALDAVRPLGNIEVRCAEQRRKAQQLEDALQRGVRALPHWSGDLDRLRRLSVPLDATVARNVAELEAVGKRRQALQAELEAVQKQVAATERDLSASTRSGEPPSQQALMEARRARDQLWSGIAAATLAGTRTVAEVQAETGESDLSAALTGRIAAADGVADERFGHAAALSKQGALRQQLHAQQAEQQRLRVEREELQAQERDLMDRWRGEWPDADAPGVGVIEAQEWLKRRSELLQTRDVWVEADASASSLADSVERAVVEISARLEEVAEPGVRPRESLAALLVRASGIAAALAEAARQRAAAQRQLQDVTREVEQLKERAAALARQRLSWRLEWTRATAALGEPHLDPERATNILKQLADVSRYQENHRELAHRVEGITRLIQAFEERARQVMAACGEPGSGTAPDVAIEALNQRVGELEQAERTRATLVRQQHDDDGRAEDLNRQRVIAETELEALKSAAGVTSTEALPKAEDDSQRKFKLREDRDRIRHSLLQRNGGRDWEQIKAEGATRTPDELEMELTTAKAEGPGLDETIETAANALRDAQRALEAADRSEATAAALQGAADAAARVRLGAGEYVRLKLCSEVLKRAMEAYRKKNAGPILEAASRHFSRMTGGAHRELVTDFDDSDRPVLKSVRPSGEKVPVQGLSEGTRDQLFLSLRLGIVAHRAQKQGAFPLILDDVLVNADMERAQAILAELAGFSTHSQVLLFTNNIHVAESATAQGAHRLDLAYPQAGPGAVAAAVR